MKTTIAIDPGASGGIAFTGIDGNVHARPMPEGMTAQCDAIRDITQIAPGCPTEAVVEKVGGYMPGNSGPAAVTFARHCGHIDAALYCNGVAIQSEPTPQRWMKALGHGVTQYLPAGYKDMAAPQKTKARAEAVRRNKNAIKEDMQRRYPHLRVTFKTADALGLLTWAASCR